MPVYEYECGKCGHRFEVTQKFSDPAVSECAACHAKDVRKVLSAPAFVLKGSGWYATDYASADRKKATDSESFEKKPEVKAESGCAAGSCTNCPSKG